jgi:hypothetical protein
MKKKDREKIEEIIGEIKCPKNFYCAEKGFEYLCKANDIGLEHSLMCLECQQLLQCKFAIKYDEIFFCQCPVRVYIAKNLE